LTENLELIHTVEETLIELVRGVAVFATHSYDLVARERAIRRPVSSSRNEAKISLIESSNAIVFYRDEMEAFQIVHNTSRSQVLRAWFNHKSELDYDLVIQFTDLELVSYSISRGGL
jgi:hypothetical protein